MAADKWRVYNKWKEYMSDGTVDMDADTFKMALFTSASNAATLTLDNFAALTNQVAGGNGYTAGGETLTTVTWNESSGTVTFDADNVVWTASGGSITARFAVIYDDTVATPVVDALVAYCLMDNTPADVTATDGNTLTVQINASGIFTVSGGDTA